MESIKKLAEHIAKTVEELPNAQLKALAPAIVEATAELEKELAGIIGTGREHRFTAQNYRRALIQLRPAMEKLDQLEPALFDSLIKGHQEAIDLAQKNLEAQFQYYRDIGKNAYNFERSQFPIAIKQAARVADKSLIEHFTSSAARYPDDIKRDVKKQLALGVLRGETPHQMARRIAPKIAPYVDAGDAVGEALVKKYHWWGERIVRTELLESYNQQTHEDNMQLAQADPTLEIEWCAVNDRRECLECKLLDGTKVKPGQKFDGIYERPPAHPCCRCCTVLAV